MKKVAFGGRADFTQGSMVRNILYQAVPLTIAQLVHLLYNVVDRVYIGHMPDVGTTALTGVGITFPVIALVLAFSRLFSTGGAPLCAIARGAGDERQATRLLGNTFSMLIISGVLLTVFGSIFMEPILYLFGASEATFPYAGSYFRIYIFGTVFVMISDGMNAFINAQGYPRIGMATTIIGAVLNLILDPILIFACNMGVRGAAIATVFSQFISAAWVTWFLHSKYAVLKPKKDDYIPRWSVLKRIMSLGISGFVMQGTSGAVQVVCNATLKLYGGDIYIGVMTILNSVRDVLLLPISGMTGGAQPVLGFNYGAGREDRVRLGIRIMSFIGIGYTAIAWISVLAFPQFFIGIFNSSPEMLTLGVPSLRIYFFAVIFMSLQSAGQSTFVALGKSKQAIFFSLLRKAVIVIPFTILLPRILGLGVNGVFVAEPLSDVLGGTAAFVTMLLTVYRKLDKKKPTVTEESSVAK